MNQQPHSFFNAAVCTGTVLLLLAGGFAVGAAPAAKGPAQEINAEASAAADKPIPQSVFTVATNSTYGRNPFFPKSTAGDSAKPPADPIRSVTPVLNGLGGTPEQKLAIINNRTFAEGEEGDIVSGSVKTRIRLVEIKTDSVVIEIAGERKELRLRSGN